MNNILSFKNRRALLFLITILYFLLPMVNILFAFTALGCMIIPFLMLRYSGRKSWCSEACPRADFLSKLRSINIGLKTPGWLRGTAMRRNMLIYFGINIFFIIMSTVMVSLGKLAPIDKIRLFIAFQLPFGLPQLLPLEELSAPILHISYRFYSLMLSSTLLGILLAILFKPRTWCNICPINTLSTKILKSTMEVQNE